MAGRTTLASPVCRRDVQYIDLRVSIAAVLFSWIGKYPVRISGKMESDGCAGQLIDEDPNSVQKLQIRLEGPNV